jgi:hypothetical protein
MHLWRARLSAGLDACTRRMSNGPEARALSELVVRRSAQEGLVRLAV